MITRHSRAGQCWAEASRSSSWSTFGAFLLQPSTRPQLPPQLRREALLTPISRPRVASQVAACVSRPSGQPRLPLLPCSRPSIPHLLPLHRASLAPGWGDLTADAPTEEQARRGPEGPVPGQTKASSPFLWGTTPKWRNTSRSAKGLRSRPRGVCCRAGRASAGDNLPVTRLAAGEAGVPSPRLVPKRAPLSAAPLGTLPRLQAAAESGGHSGGRRGDRAPKTRHLGTCFFGVVWERRALRAPQG